jgi:hypothetical protein
MERNSVKKKRVNNANEISRQFCYDMHRKRDTYYKELDNNEK